MTDIVERLRRRGTWVTTKVVPLIPQENEEEWHPDPLCAEAADEIERLRTMVPDAGYRLVRADDVRLLVDTVRMLVQEVPAAHVPPEVLELMGEMEGE